MIRYLALHCLPMQAAGDGVSQAWLAMVVKPASGKRQAFGCSNAAIETWIRDGAVWPEARAVAKSTGYLIRPE